MIDGLPDVIDGLPPFEGAPPGRARRLRSDARTADSACQRLAIGATEQLARTLELG